VTQDNPPTPTPSPHPSKHNPLEARPAPLVPRHYPSGENHSEQGDTEEKLLPKLPHLLHQLVLLAQQAGNQVGDVGGIFIGIVEHEIGVRRGLFGFGGGFLLGCFGLIRVCLFNFQVGESVGGVKALGGQGCLFFFDKGDDLGDEIAFFRFVHFAHGICGLMVSGCCLLVVGVKRVLLPGSFDCLPQYFPVLRVPGPMRGNPAGGMRGGVASGNGGRALWGKRRVARPAGLMNSVAHLRASNHFDGCLTSKPSSSLYDEKIRSKLIKEHS